MIEVVMRKAGFCCDVTASMGLAIWFERVKSGGRQARLRSFQQPKQLVLTAARDCAVGISCDLRFRSD